MLNIEIEFKYWVCVTKYFNAKTNFGFKIKNMNTADPNLVPTKS